MFDRKSIKISKDKNKESSGGKYGSASEWGWDRRGG